jgi:hypothetical protein
MSEGVLMSLRHRGPTVLVTAVTLAGAMAGTAAAAAPASNAVSDARAQANTDTRSAAAVVRYWTAERMRSAIPIESTLGSARHVAGPAASDRGAPGRVDPAAPAAITQRGLTHAMARLLGPTAAQWPGSSTSPPGSTSGKVFFTGDDGRNYVCSGSTVNSAGKNVVFTAGHCVHGGGPGRRYFTNWAFVPGYRDNVRPYGTWTARQLWTLSGWSGSGNRAYDIGAAVMRTDALGRRIVNRVGGQGIEWNFPFVQYVYQFGYPSRAPFNGQRLFYCSGWTFNDGGHEGINCNMTEGASGGPWLDDFNGTFGRLDSVNSWVFWNANGVRFKWNGPYFGNGAANLYNAVANL